MPLILNPPAVGAAASIVIRPNLPGAVGQELVGGLGGIGIWLDREGNENLFPVPVYEEEYADSPDTEGAKRVRSRPQNPEGAGRVLIGATNGDALGNYQGDWQETVEAIRRHGGTLTYTPHDGTEVTFEIESLRITQMPQDGVLQQASLCASEFDITYKPYGLLASYAAVTNANGSAPLLEFEVANIPGSVDALATLKLTPTSQSQDLVEVCVDDERYYNPAAPTDLLLSQPDLNATGMAGASGTRSGSYSTNIYRATLLKAAIQVCSTGSQTHIGRFRLRPRLYGAGTGPIRVRVMYRIGEGPWGETDKGWVTLPGVANFYEPDLGLVDIPKAVRGSQSWEARIEAYSAVVGDTLDVDYIKVLPATRYWKGRAPQIQSALNVSAHDTFQQSGGGFLHNKASDLGGTWTSNVGDPTDFSYDSTSKLISRSEYADANFWTGGHFATLGTATPSDISMQVDFKWLSSLFQIGAYYTLNAVLARFTDANNHVFGGVLISHADGYSYPVIYQVKTGTPTLLAIGTAYTSFSTGSVWYTIRLDVTALGVATLYVSALNGTPFQTISGQSADLVSGTLATGKRGVLDSLTQPAAGVTRSYANLIIADTLPSSGHVINSGKAMELRNDRAIYEPTSGTNWGRVPDSSGAYLKLPPAGREGLTTRIAVSHHRLDVDELPATNIADAVRVDLTVEPRVTLLGR